MYIWLFGSVASSRGREGRAWGGSVIYIHIGTHCTYIVQTTDVLVFIALAEFALMQHATTADCRRGRSQHTPAQHDLCGVQRASASDRLALGTEPKGSDFLGTCSLHDPLKMVGHYPRKRGHDQAF